MDIRLILFLVWKLASAYNFENESNPCVSFRSRAMPHPSSCHKYLLCQRGEPTEFNCPYDWQFDAKTAACKPPGRATCHPRPVTTVPPRRSLPPVPTTTPLPPITCQPPTSSTAEPTTEHSTSKPSTTEHSTSKPSTTEHSTIKPSTTEHSTTELTTLEPSTTEPTTIGPCTITEVLPDLTDCKYYFIICENDNKIREKCPLDYLFDPKRRICLPPYLVQCNATKTSTPPPSTTKPSTTSGPSTIEPSEIYPCNVVDVLIDPDNCRYYFIMCSEGDVRIREECPLDYLFDPYRRVCLPPDMVTCKDTLTTQSPSTIKPSTATGPSTIEPSEIYPCNVVDVLIDPDNCRYYFIMCSEGDVRIREECPLDYLFDPYKRVCLPPDMVICKDTLTTQSPSTINPSTASGSSTIEPSEIYPCNVVEVLIDPQNCRYYFIRCFGDVWIREECPLDYLFDPYRRVCLPPDMVICKTTLTTQSPSTIKPSTASGTSTIEPSEIYPCNVVEVLMDPQNCRYYFIRCFGDVWIREECPLDYLFDPYKRVCLPPDMVICKTTLTTQSPSTIKPSTASGPSTIEPSEIYPCNVQGVLLDPENCRYYFILCEGDVRIHEECPLDYLFDPYRRVCLPPDMVKCKVTLTTQSPSTTEPSTTEPSTVGPCNITEVLPDLIDCKYYFIICENGIRIREKCRFGYRFDPKRGVCLPSYLVRCDVTTTTISTQSPTTELSTTEHLTTEPSTNEPSTVGPCNITEVLPDLTDCKYYFIICENGISIREECPLDYLFDPKRGVCLPPYLVQCNITTTTTTTSTQSPTTTELSTTEHLTTEPSTTDPSTTEPSTTEPTTIGPCNITEVLPDLTDCKYYFIICENGISIREECPFNYLFDPKRGVCLPSYLVRCNVTTTSTSTTTTTTTSTQSPTTTELSTTEHLTTEPSTTEPSTVGPCNVTEVLPDLTDCKYYFIICENGISIREECPFDYLFDPKRGVCLPSYLVQCNVTTTTTTTSTQSPTTTELSTTEHLTTEPSTTEPTTVGPCNITEVLPDLTDCKYYFIICENGISIREECPFNYLFDPKRGVCLPSYLVRCNVTTTSTTTTTTTTTSTQSPTTTELITTDHSTTEPSTTEPSTTEPSTTEPSTVGPCNITEVLPDLTDCKYYFIICENGISIREECPLDYLFDPKRGVCLPPYLVQCNITTTTTTTSTQSPTTTELSTTKHSTIRPSTTKPSTTKPSTTEPSTTEPSTTEPSTTEPSTTEPSTIGPCKITELLPDLTDCKYYFIICENGDSIREKCPFHYLFDPMRRVCLPSYLVRCDVTTTTTSTQSPTTTEPSTTEPSTTEPSTIRPCKITEVLPDLTDCEYYFIICENGESIREKCPFHYLFDPMNRVCLPSYLVQCNVTTTTTTTTTSTQSPTTTEHSTTESPTTEPPTTEPPTTEPPTTKYSTSVSPTQHTTEKTTPSATTTTNPTDIICKETNDFYYLPDPTDCRFYYVCIYGVAHHKKCLYNFYFSERYQMCVPQNIADCNITTTVSPGTPTTTRRPKPTTSTASPTPTPKPNRHCRKYESKPDPSNCHYYYACKYGRFVHKKCPSKYEFSVVYQVCLPRYLANCSIHKTTTTPRSTTPSGTTLRPVPHPVNCNGVRNKKDIPDPDNCSLFYTCIRGVPLHRRCPFDYQFSKEYLECLPPNKAQCNLTTTTISPSTSTTEASCATEEFRPDKTDCRYYYVVCDTGEVTRAKCPFYFEFSPVLLMCLPPSLANCFISTTTPHAGTTSSSYTTPSLSPSPSSVATKTTPNLSTTTSIEPSPNPKHSTTPSGTTPHVPIPYPVNCSVVEDYEDVPDPKNCGYFYTCVHGVPIHRKCPFDYEFSQKYLECMPPYKAQCNLTTTTISPSTSTTEASCATEEFRPDKTDCRYYYVVCDTGEVTRAKCPFNFEFSPVLLMCLPPSLANCYVSTTTSHSETTSSSNTTPSPSPNPSSTSVAPKTTPNLRTTTSSATTSTKPDRSTTVPPDHSTTSPDPDHSTTSSHPDHSTSPNPYHSTTSSHPDHSTTPHPGTTTLSPNNTSPTPTTSESPWITPVPTPPCPAAALIPDPNNCKYYFVECYNGTLLHLRCQRGFRFSPILKVCLPKALVQCETRKRTTIKPVTTTSSPSPTSSKLTTSPEPSTTVQPPTPKPSTPRPTTTPKLTTTPEPSTTIKRSTPRPTTTPIPSTTVKRSTPRATTTPIPSTTAKRSTPRPTTTAIPSTTVKRSTPRATATPEPSTTVKRSTPRPTTTPKPSTTVKPSTPRGTTTPEPSTTVKRSTPRPTTTPIPSTTVKRSTPRPTTTPIPSTTVKRSTPRATTTPEPSTTVKPSTPRPTTTPIPSTTVKPSTPRATTTPEPSTTVKRSTPRATTTPIPSTTVKRSTPRATTTPIPSTTVKRSTPRPTTTAKVTTTNPSTTVQPTTPGIPICVNSPEKPIYYTPDPKSCRSYYICYYGDVYHEFCPKDYDFSPIYLMCLPPWQAQCLIPTPTPAVTECVTDPDETVYYYPDSLNCHRYFISYRGAVMHQTCPDHYEFDPTLLKCVPPSESTCGKYKHSN